jgi:hypothetical protein
MGGAFSGEFHHGECQTVLILRLKSALQILAQEDINEKMKKAQRRIS